jgi:membrane dipeptidase
VAIQLVKQIGRVGKEYILELEPEQEALATDIHEKSIVFDLHLHGVVLPENIDDLDEWLAARRYPFAYEGLAHAGVNAFIDGFASMSHTWELSAAVREIGLRWSEMAHHPDKVMLALRADDVRRAKKEGKIAVFMTIENTELVGADLDNIDVLYGLGVRSLGLSYNKRSLACDGRTERTDSGVSDFGLEIINRMNELGMVVDACHCGEKSTLDIAKASKAPVIVSHTGARAVYNTRRLASDDELKAVADSGGAIGIHSGVNVLSDKKQQTVDDHQHSIRKHAADGLQKYLVFNAPYMEGIENPSEWKNITRGLVKRGYPRPDIEKLIGGNALRIVQQVVG